MVYLRSNTGLGGSLVGIKHWPQGGVGNHQALERQFPFGK